MLISGSWPSGAGSVHFRLKPYYKNIHFGPLATRARIRSFFVKTLFRKKILWTPARPSPDLFIFGSSLIWKMLFSASWPSERGFVHFWFKTYLEMLILGPWPPQPGSVHFGLKFYLENIDFGPLAAGVRIRSFLIKAVFRK